MNDLTAGARAAILRMAAAEATRGGQLAAAGRLLEGERALVAALALDPAHVAAVTTLVRIRLAQGRAGEALSAITQAVAAGASLPPELHRMRGGLLLSQARLAEAIAAFREGAAAAPADDVLEQGLAAALGEAGQHADAAAAARRAIEKGNGAASAHFVLGRALWALGAYDEAEVEFLRVVRAQPMHVSAHASLADAIWMRTGDIAAATVALDVALARARAPALAELHAVKARLFEATGRLDDARAEIGAAMKALPSNADLLVEAARIEVAADANLALSHCDRALRIAPKHRGALALRADALLGTGAAERAADAAGRLLALDPNCCHATAVLATAWRMQGDARYRSLYDYAGFVRPQTIDTPDDWPDLASYLAALAKALNARHDAMRAHPLSQTLRNGTQVLLDPERDTDPAIRAFARAIERPLHACLDTIGRGEDPLRRRNTGAARVHQMWSVRLQSGGYHTSHYHNQGWLSSACYIDLPSLSQGEGWLQFGAPCMPTTPALDADYFVKPEPGLLVLFPSWMWHGTTPLACEAGKTRLSVAFDVVPA